MVSPAEENSFSANDRQGNRLMDFVSTDQEMRTGEFLGPNGKVRLEKKWNQVAMELNSLGYAKKSGERWKDAWVDLKSRSKKAFNRKKGYMGGTGGGVHATLANLGLTQVQKRCLQLIDLVTIIGNEEVPDPLQIGISASSSGQLQSHGGRATVQHPVNTRMYEGGPSAVQHWHANASSEYSFNQRKQSTDHCTPKHHSLYQKSHHTPPFGGPSPARKRLSYSDGNNDWHMNSVAEGIETVSLKTHPSQGADMDSFVEGLHLHNARIASAVDAMENMKQELGKTTSRLTTSVIALTSSIDELNQTMKDCNFKDLAPVLEKLSETVDNFPLKSLEDSVVSFSESINNLSKLS